MKRIIAALLVSMTALMVLAGCSHKCDICGSTEDVEHIDIFDNEVNICKKCFYAKS